MLNVLCTQRVFNVLSGTRLFRRMIWLLPPPPLFRKKVVSLSESSYVSPVELTDGGGGGREGAKSYYRSTVNHQIVLYRTVTGLLSIYLHFLFADWRASLRRFYQPSG